MTIKEYMKTGRVEGDASTLKRVACVDIAFINRKGERDETQLTVSSSISLSSFVPAVDAFISLKPASISEAIILASVVFPVPDGP